VRSTEAGDLVADGRRERRRRHRAHPTTGRCVTPGLVPRDRDRRPIVVPAARVVTAVRGLVRELPEADRPPGDEPIVDGWPNIRAATDENRFVECRFEEPLALEQRDVEEL